MERNEQIAALRHFLKTQVLPFSTFYRELFAKNNLCADGIQTEDDLQKIPFTSKDDLLPTPDHPNRMKDFVLVPDEAELKHRPSVVGAALLHGRKAVHEKMEAEYRPVFLTSTTGRSSEPVPFLYTKHDIENLSRAGHLLVEVFGGRTEDRVLNMFPYAPHLAFWQAHYAALSHGIFCVSSGGGKVMGTEGNIRLLTKIKPTVLIAMPTFLYHFLRQAIDEGVRADQVRLLILGGEKVPDGMRQNLRELAAQLGSPNVQIVATYGFTEAKMAWAECPTADGSPSGYHIPPDLALIEIIDPATGLPQPDGTGGEIVFTPLDARGTVVLRYRTGDKIDGGIVHAPCPHCGRDVPRLVGKISRVSSVVEMNFDKIRGTIVDFDHLEHVLDDLQEIGTWQIELRKLRDDPLEMDELILHAEKKNGIAEDLLREHINDVFSARTELRLNRIDFHDVAELRHLHGVGTALKEKRVVDNRPKVGTPAPPGT